MYFIENSRLIECKNKALNNWSKHNFIFNKFSDLVVQKITELKKEFKDILIISADFDETISKITKLQFDNLFHFSQYKCFLEKISLNNKKIIRVFSSFESNPFNEESFDLVICNFCFHNINNKNEYLKNIMKILKKMVC